MLRHTLPSPVTEGQGEVAPSSAEPLEFAEMLQARVEDRVDYLQRHRALARLARRLERGVIASGVLIFEGFWIWLFLDGQRGRGAFNFAAFVIVLLMVNLLGIPFLNAWLEVWKLLWKKPVEAWVESRRLHAGVDDHPDLGCRL